MLPWFKTGGRLQDELNALDSEGIEYEIDREAEENGVLRLHLELRAGPWGEPHSLVATYPDAYPYFRPLVVATDLVLRRHQHPFDGNLCLLGRSSLYWDVNKTLAAHLVEQLPVVLEAAKLGNDELASDAREQAEPYSDYYPYPVGAHVLVDSQIRIPAKCEEGSLVLAVADLAGPALRAAILQVRDVRGKTIAEADSRAAAPFRGGRLTCRWVRRAEPIRDPNANRVLSRLTAQNASGLKGARMSKPATLQVHAFVFPEEKSPGQYGDSWLFLVRTPSRRRKRTCTYYARSMRYDSSSMLERAPELRPLPRKKVGLVGLGCVGAPAALELLRSGLGILRVMDADFVDAGTILRWPFGIGTVGQFKTDVVKLFAAANYPFSKVEPFVHRIGEVYLGDFADKLDRPPFDLVSQFIDELDLVIDASAEFGVQHYLAELARERGIPFLHMSGTLGGWGGVVFRVVPKRSEACWYCVRHWIEAGSLPSPPEATTKEAQVQPDGCADPTFTGAGFDLSHVSLEGVRMAVATLCSGASGYPDFGWDYGALSLRTASGEPMAPAWDTAIVPRHPACAVCGD